MKIPKTGNILIPDIKIKIGNKLKELNLKPKITPQEFFKTHGPNKHRYFSPCITSKKEEIAFYSRVHNNLDAKGKFLREIRFLEKLKKSRLRIRKIVPRIIDYGIEKDFEWLKRQYPKIPPLGYSRNLKQKVYPETITKIIKAVFDISKISPRVIPKLKKFKYQNYLSLDQYESLVEKKLISKEIAERNIQLIGKNLPLIKKENKYFCHGDLNLGNILSDRNKIWLIDWELVHLNNFAYDIGYLWAHLWEAKRKFRKKLIESYIRKLDREKMAKFKNLLPGIASYLSIGGLRITQGKRKKGLFKKRINFYVKLLENCQKFEKLIKT